MPWELVVFAKMKNALYSFSYHDLCAGAITSIQNLWPCTPITSVNKCRAARTIWVRSNESICCTFVYLKIQFALISQKFHVVDAICACHCDALSTCKRDLKKNAQGTSIINAKKSLNAAQTIWIRRKERKAQTDCGKCNLFACNRFIGKFRYWFSFCSELLAARLTKCKPKLIFVIDVDGWAYWISQYHFFLVSFGRRRWFYKNE